MSPRTTPEWIGSTPDAVVPDRVKLRVFRRAGGVCHIAKRKIAAGEAWDLDHVIALRDGGEHRESNLAPALKTEHARKTAAEAKARAKIDRIAKKNLGIRKQSGFRAWRKFDGTIVRRENR